MPIWVTLVGWLMVHCLRLAIETGMDVLLKSKHSFISVRKAMQ